MAIMEGLLCYDINRKKWGSRLQPLGTLLMRIHLLWSLTCHQMRWRIAYVEFEPTVFSKLSYNLLCGLGRPRKLFGWRCFAQVQTDPFSAIQLLVSSIEAFSVYLGLNPQVFVYIAYVSSQTYLTFFSASSGI